MRSIFTFQTFKSSEPTHLFSSFKILRNFSALVWLLVAFTCSLANASSRRRIDFFTVTEPGEARHNICRQMSTDIFKYIHTMTQRHATETRKAVNSQSFIYSIIRVRLKNTSGQQEAKDFRRKHTNHRWQNDWELHEESYFVPQKLCNPKAQ